MRKFIKLIVSAGLIFNQLEEKKKELEKIGVIIGSDYLNIAWLNEPVEKIRKRYIERLTREVRKVKKEYEEIGEFVDFPEIIKEIEPQIEEGGKIFKDLLKELSKAEKLLFSRTVESSNEFFDLKKYNSQPKNPKHLIIHADDTSYARWV